MTQQITLSLALYDQVQVSGIVSGVNTKKGRAEVTPYDLANWFGDSQVNTP